LSPFPAREDSPSDKDEQELETATELPQPKLNMRVKAALNQTPKKEVMTIKVLTGS
jgi:hypothetical protein